MCIPLGAGFSLTAWFEGNFLFSNSREWGSKGWADLGVAEPLLQWEDRDAELVAQAERVAVCKTFFCEPLEGRVLFDAAMVATESSVPVFGNVSVSNSAGYNQDIPVGTTFTSTVSNLPSHTELTHVEFGVLVVMGQNDTQLPGFDLKIDGQSVPVEIGWSSPGASLVKLDASFLHHTADQAVITIEPTGLDSSDTFSIYDEDVSAGQDVWVNSVQSDAFRDDQQPAVFDIVRGDDAGTPTATSHAQDVYFSVGLEPGLPASDGTVTPVHPSATYADYALSVAGQTNGVSYDPATDRFKVVIPAGQASVEIVLTPTNLWGEPGVQALSFDLAVSNDATDPATQLPLDSNAWLAAPGGGDAVHLPQTQPGAIHGLAVRDDSSTLCSDQFADLLNQLGDDDYHVRDAAKAELGGLISQDPSEGVENQLAEALSDSTNPEVKARLQSLIDTYFPMELVADSNQISFWASSALTNAVGAQNFYDFTVTVSGPASVGFDVNGTLVPTWSTVTGDNGFSVPDIIVDPSAAGSMTVTVTYRLMSYDPVTRRVDAVAPAQAVSMNFTIANTNP
ncbi:MAG TPA: hypothetical protein VLJ39_23140 [Tepidisphaeraceae bacterium]|nr:hypothetical protein [Tepidisphaeraceae bacterium]